MHTVKTNSEELLAELKPKKDDFSHFFNSCPYLIKLHPRDGTTVYELTESNRFVQGSRLMFKVALRDNETLSGSLRKVFGENVERILDIVNKTIKYYTDEAKKHNRRVDVELREPYGLLVYERPETRNQRLAHLYSELFRDNDGRGGGTAGMLLIETRENLESAHLEKAINSARALINILREETTLPSVDKKVARCVLDDLRNAINEALHYSNSEDEEGEDIPEGDAAPTR